MTVRPDDDGDGVDARADRLRRAREALAAAEGGAAATKADPPPARPADDRRARAGARARRPERYDGPSLRPPPPDDPGARSRDADPHEVARAMALRLLTMAPRSRADLHRRLVGRGCDAEVAGEVLDRLERVGLVDDESYAEMLVRSGRQRKGLARTALRTELRRRGVGRDVADEALDGVTDTDEREQARALVDKRLRQLGGLPPEVQARRLAGMLARKGYPGDLTAAVVREAIRESPEHARD